MNKTKKLLEVKYLVKPNF